MNRRALVIKQAVKDARKALAAQHPGVELTDEQIRTILNGGARSIASKAIYDYADYFNETAIVVGVPLEKRHAYRSIGWRYAGEVLAGERGRA